MLGDIELSHRNLVRCFRRLSEQKLYLPFRKAMLIWFGVLTFIIVAAVCTGVGIGVGTRLNKTNEAKENKELLN